MYLYKYLFKGPDQATDSVTPRNEGSESDGLRSCSVPLRFRGRMENSTLRYWKSIPIQALAVHLPGERKDYSVVKITVLLAAPYFITLHAREVLNSAIQNTPNFAQHIIC